MKIFASLFLLSCTFALVAADSANIVMYTAQSVLGAAETFLSTIPVVNQTLGNLTFANLTEQQEGTLNVTNITVVSFNVVNPAYSYSANTSNTSIVVVNSTTFTAVIKFSFINSGNVVASGSGNATIAATNSSYSTYLGSSNGKPYHALTNFNITWGAFSVQTDYSANPNDPVNLNITATLNTNFSSMLNQSLTESTISKVFSAYNQVDSTWQTDPEYDFTLRRTFLWNNSISAGTLDPTDLGTVATINGSIEAKGYIATADTTTAVLNRTGKPHQLAYSLQGFKNFIQYGFDNGFFVWGYDSESYPLNIFDYTIADLMNVVPSLGAQLPESAFVQFTCVPNNSFVTTFNAATNLVNLDVQVKCGINVVGSTAVILNVTFNSTLSVAPSIENTGTLNFNIASGTYTASTAAVQGQTLSATQTAILEFYIRGALLALPGTYCFYGSGIELPTTSMTNTDYKFDANWLYISYY